MTSNPNKIISLQELINAQVDAKVLELIMNEAPLVEVETRLGRKCYSISTIQAIIDQYKLQADVEIANLTDAINVALAAGAGAAGWIDSLVKTWSGRTQESKNKDTVSALDFGIIPNSLEDQTSKFDNFFNYLRNNKCKGVIPKAGRILVTANKTKIFGVIGETAYQELKYALDISGVDLTGIYKGYENVDGTIIDAQNTGCALLQAQSDTNNTTYSLTNLRVDKATVPLKMTYALMCRITNFVYKDSVNGVILGEPTFSAGAMSNVFTNIYGTCSGAPLQLLGKQWNNANQFHSCFWTGGEPSYIHVSGGYGAIANSFHGGEFNTIKDSKSSGLILGNCRSTNFFGTYFEPRGHCVILDGQAKKVLLSGCTFGTTRSDATQSTVPCHIWHKSGAASVNIVGGSVFLGDDTGLQDNMRFVYSDAPSTFICNILDNPWAMTTGTTGWKIADITNVSKFESFSGQITDSTPIAFSSDGGSISGLMPESKATYQVNGKMVTVVVDLAFDANTAFNTGNYYINLLFNPKLRAEGVVRFSKSGGGSITGSCGVSQSNKNLFLWIPRIIATFNDVTKTVSASLNNEYASNANMAGYNIAGSRVVAQINYPI